MGRRKAIVIPHTSLDISGNKRGDDYVECGVTIMMGKREVIVITHTRWDISGNKQGDDEVEWDIHRMDG